MPVSDAKRAVLHDMLDALLDEIEAETPAMQGVLLLREVVVSREAEVDRHLSIRGVLGEHASLLKELAKRLRQESGQSTDDDDA
jgi:hypothetical protein